MVGSFNLIADGVGQGGFHDRVRRVCLLAGPIPEAGREAVRHGVYAILSA